MRPLWLSFGFSALVGLLLTTAHPAAIAISAVAPAIWFTQPSRLAAYETSFAYYAAALWPILEVAPTFFGRHSTTPSSLGVGISIWALSAATLALPWPLAWTSNRRHALWRLPAGVFLSAIPPIGIIGVASPLAAGGFLFPGTGWLGAATTILIPAFVCLRSKSALAIIAVAVLATNVAAHRAAESLPYWKGFDFKVDECPNSWTAATTIFDEAETSNARVTVFPEAAIRDWTDVSDLFFSDRIARLRSQGKVIIFGATLSAPPATVVRPFDFSSELQVLHGASPVIANPQSVIAAPEVYRNALMVRGAAFATIQQRIPVPFAMSRLFTRTGVPINLTGDGMLTIEGQRAAVLICYEELIPWPIFESQMHHPTVIVGVANDTWIQDTSVPAVQMTYLHSWARLFGLPLVSSVAR